MMGNPVNKDAVHIFDAIPPNTIGAEIGVWMANSSREFLKRGLKHLHLVDAWHVDPYKEQENNEHGSFEKYLEKYARITGANTEKAFQKYYDDCHSMVVAMFSQSENVTIYRMKSNDWFDHFIQDGKEKLDWIYIDGDHSFEGCYNDLTRALEVVKPGGKIFGDDYRWNPLGPGKTGVTDAVNKFLDEHHFIIKQYGQLQFEMTIK